MTRKSFLVLLVVASMAVIVTGDTPSASSTASAGQENRPAGDIDPSLGAAVAPPPFSEGIFPCSSCHDGTDVNTTRRKLDAHEDIVLSHDEKHRWCLDCHDAKNRDKLHSASGELIDFTESYRLCGQCHGDKLRDWKEGIHGKRTGSWSGAKQYLLCASCHNPHSPRFKPLTPEPPPVRPENIR